MDLEVEKEQSQSSMGKCLYGYAWRTIFSWARNMRHRAIDSISRGPIVRLESNCHRCRLYKSNKGRAQTNSQPSCELSDRVQTALGLIKVSNEIGDL